jgi:copper chaperone
MHTWDISVENIKCGGCASSIQKSMLAQPGVQSAHVDVDNGIVHISGDDTMDREHLVHRLNALGYPELGNNSLVKKAVSFVSCAAGRMHDSE